MAVCRRLVNEPENEGLRGIFHMAGHGETTWAELAAFIFEQSERFGGACARVRPITTAEYPTPAKRPMNSRLDTSKLAGVYGLWLPAWEVSVKDCVQRLIAEAQGADQ
jgi:dTDP-4-dehydrorhamnose reductase